MKQQFRNLLAQATELANEVFDYNGSDYADIVQEKFAELIVKECGRVYIQNQQDGVMTLTQDLLHHLGIKK